MQSVSVYCASSHGMDPGFAAAASSLGTAIAGKGMRLVYGGGHVGLMGVVADAALSAGGQVSGVITQALEAKEVAHLGLSDLTVVETMHERKALMSDLSDGFIMLPGGFGTLDEFFEVVTWNQLGIHSKPCGVVDVNGFFAPLHALLDAATEQKFIRPQHRDIVMTDSDPATLLERMESWRPVPVDKWLDRSER